MQVPIQRPADSPSDDEPLSAILEHALLKEFYAKKAADLRAAREAAAEQVPVVPVPVAVPAVVPVVTATSSPVRRTRSTGGLGPRLVYEVPATPITESPAELRK